MQVGPHVKFPHRSWKSFDGKVLQENCNYWLRNWVIAKNDIMDEWMTLWILNCEQSEYLGKWEIFNRHGLACNK